MTPEQRAALVAAESALVAGNASLTALAEAIRVLRASLTDADPPPPPPPTPSKELQSRTINMAKVLQIGTGVSGDRYQRFQIPMVASGEAADVRVRCCNMAAGGGFVPLLGEYVLAVDGVDARIAEAAPGATQIVFSVDLKALQEGWHWLDARGPNGETCVPQAMYVRKDAKAVAQPSLPIITHSHAMEFRPDGVPSLVHWGMVPATGKPVAIPLSLRECVPFSTTLTRADLACEMLVPWGGLDIHRPTLTDDGVLTTAGSQYYFWHHFTARMPALPLLDGPRGVGSVSMPTHLQVGRNGKVYFCDPWRVGKIAIDGTITTLAGWRSQDPPSHWNAAPRYDLIGDWSDVPAERRGFHELWGMAWDERTLTVNEAADPIPTEGNEKPHVTGPVMFVADSQNNRICRIEFSATTHGPGKVTEFITGLADPWDVVCSSGVLYVSERKAHRIVAFDATTGRQLKVLAQGADLATVSAARFPNLRPGVTLDQARREDVVLPEGLYLQDGWLYFGSRVMAQIKRMHLQSGAVEVVRNLIVDGNSYFVKFAVSDGTFGPRGTLFVSTWSNGYFSFPHAYAPSTPAGKVWEYLTTGASRGGMWAATSYSTAVAVGAGRMACGGVQAGINVIRKALPADQAFDASTVKAGRIQWYARGHYLLHGPAGYGNFGLPLPWGETPDMDSYLRFCGHEVGK